MAHDLLHSFPGQERDEPVFVFARPYVLSFLPTLLVFLAVYAFSLFAQYAVASNLFFGFETPIRNAAILGLGIFQLITVTVFFVAILDFYFDIFIVTDRRLVDIDQNQLFHRTISELALTEVQDASSNNAGFFATVFDYGNVSIQTAGARANFEIEKVRYPREIAALVLDLSEQARNQVPNRQRMPETNVFGIINDTVVRSPQELAEVGAMRASRLAEDDDAGQ